MILARPLLLLLLLAAIPVVWAFLRKAPPRRLPAGSLMLLRVLQGAPRKRRRIDRLLRLFLILCALLALVAALAFDPAPPAGPTWVLLDDSASMGATGPDGRRIDRARGQLADWLADHPEAPVGLIRLAPLQVELRPSLDHKAMLDFIFAVEPKGAQADPLPLLAGLCAEPTPPRLLVLSESLLLPADLPCPVERVDLGPPTPNQGIVDLRARPADGLGLWEIAVTVAGEGAVALNLSVDGQPSAPSPVTGSGLLWLSLPAGGALRLSTPADAFSQDDEATLKLDGGGSVNALLITDEPQGFAALALGAHPRVQLSVAAPDTPPPPDPVDLLVLEAPLAKPWPEARRVLVLGLPIDGEPGPLLRAPNLREQADDPLLRWVSLTDIQVRNARVLPDSPGSQPLLLAEEGALAQRRPRPDGSALLVFSFGLSDSDLGLRAAWVNLVANLVEEAAPLAPVVVSADPCRASRPPSRPPKAQA